MDKKRCPSYTNAVRYVAISWKIILTLAVHWGAHLGILKTNKWVFGNWWWAWERPTGSHSKSAKPCSEKVFVLYSDRASFGLPLLDPNYQQVYMQVWKGKSWRLGSRKINPAITELQQYWFPAESSYIKMKEIQESLPLTLYCERHFRTH